MSAKREYLWSVFKTTPQSPKLVEAALIFYHAEVPVEQAREYLAILATKIKEKNGGNSKGITTHCSTRLTN